MKAIAEYIKILLIENKTLWQTFGRDSREPQQPIQ